MAPDPKEVRIGSHVEYRGDMCRVSYIAPKDKIYQFYLRRKGYPFDIHAHVFEVNPIPITEDLLMEIGFEKHDIHGKEVYRKIYIEIPKLGTMFYALCYNPIAEAWDFQAHPTMSEVKYLHELESMVYMATKQELIND